MLRREVLGRLFGGVAAGGPLVGWLGRMLFGEAKASTTSCLTQPTTTTQCTPVDAVNEAKNLTTSLHECMERCRGKLSDARRDAIDLRVGEIWHLLRGTASEVHLPGRDQTRGGRIIEEFPDHVLVEDTADGIRRRVRKPSRLRGSLCFPMYYGGACIAYHPTGDGGYVDLNIDARRPVEYVGSPKRLVYADGPREDVYTIAPRETPEEILRKNFWS